MKFISCFFYFNLRYHKKEKMPTTFIAIATKRDIHFLMKITLKQWSIDQCNKVIFLL